MRWYELSTSEVFGVVLQSNILDEKELLQLIKMNSNNAASRTSCKYIFLEKWIIFRFSAFNEPFSINYSFQKQVQR